VAYLFLVRSVPRVIYKTICPACGAKLSRRYMFFEPKWTHRCRSCGTLLRSSVVGVVATFFVVAVLLVCFVAYFAHLLSAVVAITLLLLIAVASFILLPYLTRADVVTPNTSHDEQT
jgi:uncharacterized protein (DUF983 family)